MEFDANMVTNDGKKMMYLFTLAVKKECPDYDKIWEELYRRMNAVSIPIVRVDWPLSDDNGKLYDYSEDLFYARTFEIGMGFIRGILKDSTIRQNIEYCNFFNGGNYKNDNKEYDWESSLESNIEVWNKYHPNEKW